jgi:NAD(P)H-nitrite reductase large subunit
VHDAPDIIAVGEVILWQNSDYGVQRHLSFHQPNLVITYEEV